MDFLTQKELKEMFLLSYQKIEEKKEEINKINLFPVPDQDTGNNLAKTLLGIKEAIIDKEFKDLKEFSDAILEGALTAAQGNAGVIYVGFLAGFLPHLDKNPINAKKLATAFEEGRKRARQSIQNPKEGTILDVIEAATETIKGEAETKNDFIDIFKTIVKRANEALLATREKMEIFRKANVVDAGGLGFLVILESYLESLEPAFVKGMAGGKKPSEKIGRFVQILSNRYEIVALIKNPKVNEKTVQEKLKKLGNSLDIVQIGNKMKIHFHTDYPEEVKNAMRTFGQIEELREEDMAKEMVGEVSVRKVSVGIVTENIASILPKILERYQIETVKAVLDWPELEKFPGENVYQKTRETCRAGTKALLKTPQAAPKSYLEAYKKQIEKFDKVLSITVSSKISGCYNSALQAKTRLEEEGKTGKVCVIDSLNAAAGQALLILRAIELVQEQREVPEILTELKKLIPRVHLYIVFESPKGVESTGQITKNQAKRTRRIKKIGLHSVMELKNGIIRKSGIIFAKDSAEALVKKILRESEKIRKAGGKIRIIINHANNLERARKIKEILKKTVGVEVSFISESSPIICAATGLGALMTAWAPTE